MTYYSLLYSHKMILKVFASIGSVNHMQRQFGDRQNLPQDLQSFGIFWGPQIVFTWDLDSLTAKKYLFQICTTPFLSTSCKDCSSFRSNCCIGKMKVESSTNIPFFHRNEDSKHYRNVVKTTDTTHLENLFQKLYLALNLTIKMKNFIAFFQKDVLLGFFQIS